MILQSSIIYHIVMDLRLIMKKHHVKFTYVIALLILFTHESSAQWVQYSGPYGGSINALAISGNNIFAGTSYGGVFLSTNNGTSWTAVNSGLTGTLVKSLAISGNNIFAGTDRGLFLSINNGKSWTAVINSFDPYIYDVLSGSDGRYYRCRNRCRHISFHQ